MRRNACGGMALMLAALCGCSAAGGLVDQKPYVMVYVMAEEHGLKASGPLPEVKVTLEAERRQLRVAVDGEEQVIPYATLPQEKWRNRLGDPPAPALLE